jgi:ketosteroid isomerase-like protein
MTKHAFFVILSVTCFSLDILAQTPTESLVRKFHDAWNEEDIAGMIAMLHEDAFFKSPFQLRYGREEMAKTVLITNPPIFKVTEIQEMHSRVDGNMAWSIGKMKSDVYNEWGLKEQDPWHNDYVYLFVLKDGEWKLQMMVFHE